VHGVLRADGGSPPFLPAAVHQRRIFSATPGAWHWAARLREVRPVLALGSEERALEEQGAVGVVASRKRELPATPARRVVHVHHAA
jgi:hypothetical protein